MIKTLDKYIAKNFIVGYVISFMVLIGLRVLIDLFVNIDEFTEHKGLSSLQVIYNIVNFYGLHLTLYFRDFAGIITVVAAVFSLGKMTKNNELIAVMASGVSLKRVIAPIVIICILLTGALVINQELIIPSIANQLTRSHDDIPGQQVYAIVCMGDSKGSIINASTYKEAEETLYNPSIILKKEVSPGKWENVGWVIADKAVYNRQTNEWDLTMTRTNTLTGETTTGGGLLQKITPPGQEETSASSGELKTYKSDLVPEIIPIRRKEQFTSLLSSKQLHQLAKHGTKVKDQAKLYLQKHSRVTDPILNVIMLLVALPILVCRDSKAMKSAIVISFGTTMACFVAMFASKMLGTEVFLGQIRPEIFVWLPVMIFLPIAVIEIDSMKT